jgi:hypothetical protein
MPDKVLGSFAKCLQDLAGRKKKTACRENLGIFAAIQNAVSAATIAAAGMAQAIEDKTMQTFSTSAKGTQEQASATENAPPLQEPNHKPEENPKGNTITREV